MLLRSFSRRVGKKLSEEKRRALSELDEYVPLMATLEQGFMLEIGIGMGEHFVANAASHAGMHFLGIEPYLNGVANTIRMIRELGLQNVSLFADDADLLLGKLPLCKGIYALFPDPWPKQKQQKRRFLNQERLAQLYGLLEGGGCLYFASDIQGYVTQVTEQAGKIGFVAHEGASFPIPGYQPTRYHQKAVSQGREPWFLTWQKPH